MVKKQRRDRLAHRARMSGFGNRGIFLYGFGHRFVRLDFPRKRESLGRRFDFARSGNVLEPVAIRPIGDAGTMRFLIPRTNASRMVRGGKRLESGHNQRWATRRRHRSNGLKTAARRLSGVVKRWIHVPRGHWRLLGKLPVRNRLGFPYNRTIRKDQSRTELLPELRILRALRPELIRTTSRQDCMKRHPFPGVFSFGS